ncbi:hypothetical protein [Paraburkholderia sp. IW21]|uniref:hypothetical protein n=1 Tax=Paraburkholderia sp. IW21 TaxID=3242488 RepID=UPI003522859C
MQLNRNTTRIELTVASREQYGIRVDHFVEIDVEIWFLHGQLLFPNLRWIFYCWRKKILQLLSREPAYGCVARVIRRPIVDDLSASGLNVAYGSDPYLPVFERL